MNLFNFPLSPSSILILLVDRAPGIASCCPRSFTFAMILGQISYLDCLVFLLFLAPQLLVKINIFQLVFCVISALPFFCELLLLVDRLYSAF